MSEKKSSKPIRAGLVGRATPEPCSLVIFGATGDLTHRKLIPALYNLAADGDLPPGMNVIGFARRDKTDEVFRQELEEAAKKFSRRPIDQNLWNGFASSIYYHRSEFGDLEGYRKLRERFLPPEIASLRWNGFRYAFLHNVYFGAAGDLL